MAEELALSAADALKARIAAARAEREATEKRDEIEELTREAAFAEMAAKDAKAVKAAEAQHGRDNIKPVHTIQGVVIVKRPELVRYRKFQDTNVHNADVVEEMARPCVVYPTPAEFDRMSDELPGLLVRIGIAATELATGARDDAAKK